MDPDTNDNQNGLPLNPLHQTPSSGAGNSPNPAADLIRQKLDKLYESEPNAKEELDEAESETPRHRSKHQQFMYELSHSGKSLAEIQTEWHKYYLGLPNHEKHQVWQEFYSEHAKTTPTVQQHQTSPEPPKKTTPVSHSEPYRGTSDPRSVEEVKQQILGRVQNRRVVRAKDHAKSLLFGLSAGGIVVILLLFSFFNERFIAPFITPSRNVSNTSIIIDPSTTAVGNDPLIIIPKINVEIPVVYNEPSIDEAAVEKALENGVVHYATTPNPGEIGNGVIFGHSSNNILNHGKYKFAFVLLKRLEVGDTFMLQKDGKRYIYKVYDKKIVKPEDVSVLSRSDKPATFTLITCDPPGTSINRLVVVGEQISPSPTTNVASKVDQNTAAKPSELPSNSESLWHRFTHWLTS